MLIELAVVTLLQATPLTAPVTMTMETDPKPQPASPQKVGAVSLPASPGLCAAPGSCRHVEDVKLHDAKGRSLVFHVRRDLPWTTQGNVMLFPGETVVVRLQPREGGLEPMLVEGGPAAVRRQLLAGEMRFRFDQERTVGSQMILHVEGRHLRPVHYNLMLVNGDGGTAPAKVCPVRPGQVMESWPQPVVQLALSNFVEVAETDLDRCS